MKAFFVKQNSTGKVREVNFFVNNDGNRYYLIGTLPNDKDDDLIAIRILLSDLSIATKRFELNNILRQELPKFNCSLVEDNDDKN